MKKVITLLGDQVAPILLLVNAIQQLNEVHILTTSFKKVQADNVIHALTQLHPSMRVQYHILSTHNDPEVVRQSIQNLVQPGEDVIFDVTGGTKLMSLGAYQASQIHKGTAVYVDTQNNVILNISADTKQRVFRQSLPHIPSAIMLAAYGKIMREQKSPLAEAFLRQITTYIKSNLQAWILFWSWYRSHSIREEYAKLISSDISYERPVQSMGEDTDKIIRTISYLNSVGLLSFAKSDTSISIKISVAFDKYLHGGLWLEDFVYHQLVGKFDEVMKNIRLYNRQAYLKDNNCTSDNEVDVLVSHKGKTLFLECKAGGIKNISPADVLPKIELVAQRNAGYFARSIVVLQVRRNEIPSDFVRKARDLRIGLICQEDLVRLPGIIMGYLKN